MRAFMPSSQQRPYDLVILDLDGTILNPYEHSGVSAPVVAALRAVQAAGVPVTIATGRTLDFVVEHLAPLGIVTPVVTTQGAVIGDPVSGRILREWRLPAADARALAAWADETARVSAFFFTDDAGHIHICQNISPGQADFYDHVMGSPREIVGPFGALLAAQGDHTPVKYLMISDVANEAELPAELQARFGAGVHVSRTHPLLVEVTAAGVDKGEGVRHLLAHLGIDPARVLAIGDNENDIPVLKVVGMPIAMGNATASVKAVAQWIAPTLAEDGAAVAMQRFVLSKDK
jgi:Cof subfamily protein (haloacid dehalogenase superfamily)